MNYAKGNVGPVRPTNLIVSAAPSRKRKQYGQMGPEIKFIDSVVHAGTSGTIVGSVVSLNNLAQGTSAITRIGNKVQNKSVEIKGTLLCNSANPGPLQWKWAVVLDKEPDGTAVAAYTSIYITPGALYNISNGFRNNGESDRFVVLATDTITQVFGQESGVAHIERYIPIDVATKYIANTGAQGDFGTNQLLFTLICTGAANPAATEALAFVTARVRFTDE